MQGRTALMRSSDDELDEADESGVADDGVVVVEYNGVGSQGNIADKHAAESQARRWRVWNDGRFGKHPGHIDLVGKVHTFTKGFSSIEGGIEGVRQKRMDVGEVCSVIDSFGQETCRTR